jgi:NAD(P)-dependent dehydrogenase (short-subunit alcohol dehydrogenase family)
VSDLKFDNQVAVITGAGRGLGREYALLLAERGARVVVNDIGGSVTGEGSDESAATTTVHDIRDRGGKAIADTHDVSTPETAQAIIDTALSEWGRVDILINNAGFVGDAAFEDMTAERLNPLIDVHLKGAFFVTRPAWRLMKGQGYGRIVHTCSAAGLLGNERMSNYGAAKTGLLGLTRVLAAEANGLNIKVNAVAPIAATRMLAKSIESVVELGGAEASAAAQDVMKDLTEKLNPSLVAPVVAFLAHPECPASGEIYTVGGGQVSRFFVGRTKGYFNPQLSLEDVQTHFEEIRNVANYTVPAGTADEMLELLSVIGK